MRHISTRIPAMPFLPASEKAQKKGKETHLVIPDHPRVHLSQIMALLVMIHSLPTLTLDELLAHDPRLHGLDPRFPDMVVPFREGFYNGNRKRYVSVGWVPNRPLVPRTKKESVRTLVVVNVGGHGGGELQQRQTDMDVQSRAQR